MKVIRCNHSIDINIPDGVDVFETKDDIYSLAEYLTKEFSQRNRAVPLWQKDERGMTRDGFMADRFGRIFVIIDDIAQFCDIIYNDAGAELVNGFMQFIKMGKDHGVHFLAVIHRQEKHTLVFRRRSEQKITAYILAAGSMIRAFLILRYL